MKQLVYIWLRIRRYVQKSKNFPCVRQRSKILMKRQFIQVFAVSQLLLRSPVYTVPIGKTPGIVDSVLDPDPKIGTCRIRHQQFGSSSEIFWKEINLLPINMTYRTFFIFFNRNRNQNRLHWAQKDTGWLQKSLHAPKVPMRQAIDNILKCFNMDQRESMIRIR